MRNKKIINNSLKINIMKKVKFEQIEKIIKIVFFTFLTIALSCVLWNIIVNKAPIYL